MVGAHAPPVLVGVRQAQLDPLPGADAQRGLALEPQAVDAARMRLPLPQHEADAAPLTEGDGFLPRDSD